MKKTILWIGVATLCFAFASCSDEANDEKYRSEPPTFSDLTFKTVDTGSETIHVGEKFVVTAEQKKLRRLLNTTTYSWSVTPNSNSQVSQKYVQSVIYDQETQNPTDTLVITEAGDYEITFTARYNVSGNTTVWSSKYGYTYSESFADGNGTATYTTGGLFYFGVTATKSFSVVE